MNNESQTPHTPPPIPADNRGSRWLGFGLYWAITIIGGSTVLSLIGAMFGNINNLDISLYFGVLPALPFLITLALGIGFAVKGKKRTAQGILFGFLSQIALILLLVAACFGIVALGNAH
jgi:hypothetical protein